MRNLFLSFCLLFSISSFSGGFRWPNVQYDYAKLHLFNIDLEKPNLFDWTIYKDGIYANSKKGSGYDLNEKFLNEIHGHITRGKGVPELRMGLAKCYMPRHGIIYYDRLGNPVASFTICFECDKIVFWSSNEIPHLDYDDEHDDWQAAEKLAANLKTIFVKAKYPVFNNDAEYLAYLKADSTLEDLGEMFMTDPNLDSLYFKRYSIEDVKGWVKSGKKENSLREIEETKISAGGERWTYKQLEDLKRKNRFVFSFDEVNPFLVEATITDHSIVLPNGMSVGMSVDDVQGTFMVYDGIAWPEHIQVKDKMLIIDYYFKHHTLVKIKASFDIR